tara:strand:+ start:21 stop:146 length:126 start_codon:yes stop_codon:yes gene_type:complete
MKWLRVKTIEDARKEHKKLFDEDFKKTSIFKSYFLFEKSFA